jgi:hypothetical protein
MTEEFRRGARRGSVLVDVGEGAGAIVVFATAALLGREIEVSPRSDDARRTHTEVIERVVNARREFAAVFPSLPAGGYRLWGPDGGSPAEVAIVEGEVTQVDWRHLAPSRESRWQS